MDSGIRSLVGVSKPCLGPNKGNVRLPHPDGSTAEQTFCKYDVCTAAAFVETSLTRGNVTFRIGSESFQQYQ